MSTASRQASASLFLIFNFILLGIRREPCPTIHLEAVFSLDSAHGPLFTIAHGVDPVRVHFLHRQKFLYGVCAAVTETEVVLLASAFVRITVDRETDVGIFFQERRIALKKIPTSVSRSTVMRT